MAGQAICDSCDGLGEIHRDACKVDGISYPAIHAICDECQGSGQLCDWCYEPYGDCDCPQDDEATP
jgi:DnaJ-class molecular chaperone